MVDIQVFLLIPHLSNILYIRLYTRHVLSVNSSLKSCIKCKRVNFSGILSDSFTGILFYLQECIKFMHLHFSRILANIAGNGCKMEKTWYMVPLVGGSPFYKPHPLYTLSTSLLIADLAFKNTLPLCIPDTLFPTLLHLCVRHPAPQSSWVVDNSLTMKRWAISLFWTLILAFIPLGKRYLSLGPSLPTLPTPG